MTVTIKIEHYATEKALLPSQSYLLERLWILLFPCGDSEI